MRTFDVVHGPNYKLPECDGPAVVTVHDLSVFRFPETHPIERIREFEQSFHATVARAAHLITDCETIRQELIAFAGVPTERVTAVPLGVSEKFRPMGADALASSLKKAGLRSKSYGLTVSSLEPRKRIDKLLEAWRILPRRLRDALPLAIAGAPGWQNQELLQAIERGRAEGWVIPLGFVAEPDLPGLYANAALFAYPSIYEGFGLPPLEAMASGVPAIIAGGSCLSEVTGDASVVADPNDVEGFAEILARCLEDEEWRRDRISAGLRQASRYSWDRCTDETVAAYAKAAFA